MSDPPTQARSPVAALPPAVRIAAGLTCLLGPLVCLAVAMVVAPARVEDAVVARVLVRLNQNDPFLARWKIYSQRLAIEAVAKVRRTAADALALAGLAGAACAAAHLVLRNRFGAPAKRLVVETAAFACALTAISFWWHAPAWPVLVTAGTLIFAFNFAVPSLVEGQEMRVQGSGLRIESPESRRLPTALSQLSTLDSQP